MTVPDFPLVSSRSASRRWSWALRAACASLACLCAPALRAEEGREGAAAPAASPALLAGEITVERLERPGAPVPTFRARARVDAPPALVWDLVSHCDGYAAVMPRVLASRELRRDAAGVECTVTIDMPFPLSDLTSVTIATHREDPSTGRYSRTWRFVRGDYQINEGAWEIVPLPGGGASLVTYQVTAKPNLPVPAGFASLFQKGPLVDAMRALRTQAAARLPTWRPESAAAPVAAPTAPSPG